MYTQEQNELLSKVEQLQKERGISQNEVGKLMGISGTALLQIKNGKYAADPQKVFDKIAEYFGIKEKAQLTYTELKYVSTSISAQIYDIIGACQVKGGLAVAAGDAGIAGLPETEASDTAYLINEAAAWENICAFVKVNNDNRITEEILSDVITKVNAAVNVSRGMKTEIIAAGGNEYENN